MDLVVPLPVERVSFDEKLVQFGVRDLASFVVLILVEPAVDLEACLGPRCPDQLDDDCQRFQGNALPIAGDVAEDAMFDLVPFACSRREMADLNDHPHLVGEFLKFEFPQSVARAIAATTIGRNQQSPRVPVPLLSQPVPPATDRFHGKLGRVVGDPHGNTSLVVIQIRDALRNCLAQFRVRKIRNIDFHGIPFSAVRSAGILEISQDFLLLRINGQCRFTTSLSSLDSLGDVFKLGIPVRVLGSLARLAVRLKAEAGRLQQLSHLRGTHFKAIRLQRTRQGTSALAGPSQRGLRVPTGIRFHQSFEGCH